MAPQYANYNKLAQALNSCLRNFRSFSRNLASSDHEDSARIATRARRSLDQLVEVEQQLSNEDDVEELKENLEKDLQTTEILLTYVDKLKTRLSQCSQEVEKAPESLHYLELEVRYICFYVRHLRDLVAIITVPTVYNALIKRGHIDIVYFELMDLNNVQSQFPNAQQPLMDRLVKSISRRRRRLLFQMSARGTNSEEPMQVDDDEYEESSDSGEAELEREQRSSPETRTEQQDCSSGQILECNLCLERFILNSDESEYVLEHVDHDLQPYICTFDDCGHPSKTYPSQSEWFQHEIECRRKSWDCHCDDSHTRFASEAAFQIHWLQKHRGDWRSVEDATEAYATEDLELKMKSVCRLCEEELDDLESLKTHLGDHMRELAVLSLP